MREAVYPVYEVPADAAEDVEQMGTKQKFWFHHGELGRCLFKRARPGSGEDWSEKVAAEICSVLGIPHAGYELAAWGPHRGTITPTMLREAETLIHGNELLVASRQGYPQENDRLRFHNSEHTLEAVLDTIERSGAGLPPAYAPRPAVGTATDLLVGYLMLDALIGNTDRHHENWGIVERSGAGATLRYLAPTYDHASSLGRNETDARRKERLETHDAGFSVEAYADRARSAFYGVPGDRKPMTTMGLFHRIASVRPEASRSWLARLAEVAPEDIVQPLHQVPDALISPLAREFAARILRHNQLRLLYTRSGG